MLHCGSMTRPQLGLFLGAGMRDRCRFLFRFVSVALAFRLLRAVARGKGPVHRAEPCACFLWLARACFWSVLETGARLYTRRRLRDLPRGFVCVVDSPGRSARNSLKLTPACCFLCQVMGCPAVLVICEGKRKRKAVFAF